MVSIMILMRCAFGEPGQVVEIAAEDAQTLTGRGDAVRLYQQTSESAVINVQSK